MIPSDTFKLPSLFKVSFIYLISFILLISLTSYLYASINTNNIIVLFDSLILSNEEQYSLLSKWLHNANANYTPKQSKLVYRYSRDSFAIRSFHKKCDNISSTLTVIHTIHKDIIGGYTEQYWNASGYQEDPHAFIFNLSKRTLYTIYNKAKAIYSSPDFGPTFGEGNILVGGVLCSLSLTAKTYGNGIEGVNLLNGREWVGIDELEVFQLLYT